MTRAFLICLTALFCSLSAYADCTFDSCTGCACVPEPPQGQVFIEADLCPNFCGGFEGGATTILNSIDAQTYYPQVSATLYEDDIPVASSGLCQNPFGQAVAAQGSICFSACDPSPFVCDVFHIVSSHWFVNKNDATRYFAGVRRSTDELCGGGCPVTPENGQLLRPFGEGGQLAGVLLNPGAARSTFFQGQGARSGGTFFGAPTCRGTAKSLN